MDGICLYCKNTMGCPLLFGRDGRFDLNRLVTEDSPTPCPKYEPILDRERKGVRERLYKLSGLGYLRTLHELPEILMVGLRQGEEDELMYENMPNFQDPHLLWEGMTSTEREDVLRYQTDENGQVIEETDAEGVTHRLARPEYHLKTYMVDPNGPIKADQSVAWVWNINQVVDHILKTEAELGLIVKVKKSKEPEAQEESEATMAGKPVQTIRTTAPKAAGAPAARGPGRPPGQKAAAAPAPAAAPKASPPAAAGPRRVNPKPPTTGTPGPGRAPTAPSGQGKVANPPRRTAAPAGAPGRPVAPKTEVSPKAASSGEFQAVMEAIKALEAKVDLAIEKADKGIKTTVECTTILNDIAAQTRGTFQVPVLDENGNDTVDENGYAVLTQGPLLYAHPSKIYAHAEGTAFDQIEASPDPSGNGGAEPEVEEVVDGGEEVGGEAEGEV